MGKKPASAKAAPDADGISLNATAKFAVLDAPGVTQSVAAAAASSSGGKAGAADGSAATTGAGLQGRRAKAGAGPRMEGAGADDEAVLIGGNSFLERTKMPSWIKVSLYLFFGSTCYASFESKLERASSSIDFKYPKHHL